MTVTSPTAKKSSRKARGKSETNAAGRELMAAMKQVHDAVMSGHPFRGMTVREVEIPDPPAYTGADVRAARSRLSVSVALFAQLMGVSAKLVEHWEQGRRTPAPLACRLLERINADPSGYLASLVKRRALPTTGT
jgi:DNA-binding transcriptional regulator YiaG